MREKKEYCCQSCGTVYSKWVGKCDACGAWNSVAEEKVLGKIRGAKLRAQDTALFDLSDRQTPIKVQTTGICEADRVLGGGLVPAAVVLIAGEPGIGKSTLLLQVTHSLSEQKLKSVYITGEESVEQVQLRAQRIGCNNSAYARLGIANNVEEIITTARRQDGLKMLIVDSIQTTYSNQIDSSPGTVAQVRTIVFELIRYAKASGVIVFLVGHVTKDGQIAGPKIVEHMVDTVIHFESDTSGQFRILRTTKNRYGPRNEIGVFEMSSKGLAEISNPSSIFMPQGAQEVSGSCLFTGIEGTRPILAEVQVLVTPSFNHNPRRTAIGWDVGRLAMMIAILSARFGLDLSNKEVYLNFAGGLKISETAADLAVIAAIISASMHLIIPRAVTFWGEVGLSGEVRNVPHIESRVKESMKLGMTCAMAPHDSKNVASYSLDACNMQVIHIKHILDLKKHLLKEEE